MSRLSLLSRLVFASIGRLLLPLLLFSPKMRLSPLNVLVLLAGLVISCSAKITCTDDDKWCCLDGPVDYSAPTDLLPDLKGMLTKSNPLSSSLHLQDRRQAVHAKGRPL
jgi:hypothetical protein